MHNIYLSVLVIWIKLHKPQPQHRMQHGRVHALQSLCLQRLTTNLHPKSFTLKMKSREVTPPAQTSTAIPPRCPLPRDQGGVSLLEKHLGEELEQPSLPLQESEDSLALGKPYTQWGPLLLQVSGPWFAFRSWTVPVSQADCWQDLGLCY